jgi:Domain of unknown function (DUF4037)
MIADPVHISLARRLADLFALLHQVRAVALGGSLAGGIVDQGSDIDIYIFTLADIPLKMRHDIVSQSGGAAQENLGLTYWGPGDQWLHAPTGTEVDIVYFDTVWMEAQIRRVVDMHEASLGYSTCLWHTVYNAQSLHDPQRWLQRLQNQTSIGYPVALQQNIIAKNYPVLRDIIPAYTNQLAKAVKRQDLVSVNHRLAALLASYFDIIFAVNRMLHPGEKKLVDVALARCAILPVDFFTDITAVIQSSCSADQVFLAKLTVLLDHLDQCLEHEGMLPRQSGQD